MTTLEAVLLGVVQGVFMFVPVSSTSHLALTQHLLAGRGSTLPAPESAEMILFDIVVHVGTLLSILLVMRGRLGLLLGGVVGDVRSLRSRPLAELGFLRLAGLGLVTVGITGFLGLAVREVGGGVFARPELIAVNLVVTGVILWWTDHAGPQWRGSARVTVLVAAAIGLAQAAALLPGLSRSGLTIAMALALGMHRPLAAEYSFFVAIPTILAAALVQSVDVLVEPAAALTIPVSAYAVGFAVAAVVGTVALAGVLRLLYAARFRYFSVYVWLLAVVVLLVGPAAL